MTAPRTQWRVPPGPGFAAPVAAVDAWRAERRDDGLAITTRTRVRGDDPNLRGHFPGLPIFPGVFVIEAVCQAMALALPGETPDLGELRSVRFLAPLLDGDELTLAVTAAPRTGGGWDVAARGRRRDGTPAVRLRAVFGAADPLPPAGPPPAVEPAGPGLDEHHDVRAALPQRHPLLLVDRVLELDPGRSVTAVKAVTGTEPCYAALPDGSGPRAYRYPRSLMTESLGQCAALLWLGGRGGTDPGDGAVLMFAGVRDLRFAGHARPGDVLRHRVRLDSAIAGTAFASGETWVGDRRIAAATALIAARRPVRPTELVPRRGTGTDRADGAQHSRTARKGTR
ncbi:3-hydroxyacyl-ACP dehydratase FabZ family protein [Actinomadura sediminis]|uniref:3-hydroxyacyl-ACP dehydratase FabZ family protein n=1 Tax=Actinomadura sediminis TaxID=1038904 RepID=A0ABW3EN20_9ACTN